jgi:hypothetical protein
VPERVLPRERRRRESRETRLFHAAGGYLSAATRNALFGSPRPSSAAVACSNSTVPEPVRFTRVFADRAELETEWQRSLAAGGLFVETTQKVAPFTPISLSLRLADGPEVTVRGSVAAPLPGGVALSLEGKPEELRARLLAPPAAALAEVAREPETEPAGDAAEKPENIWDRLRSLSHVEKVMLAAKADRSERAVLLQDSDPQVLFYLLRNPRIGVEEVVRVAKSHLLAFATAELIMKTPQWFANQDVKAALVHNPRLPTAMALRILPTLPESEIKTIAKGSAVSQTLKQAALRLIIKS